MEKEKINEYTLRITQANTSSLVVVCQDLLIEFVNEAIEYFEKSDFINFVDKLERASKCQSELINMTTVIDETSRDVMNLYIYVNEIIIKSKIKKDILELVKVPNIIATLRQGFKELAKKDDSEPLMENTHQMYSGLTYGKGHLNDSIDPILSTNRGYKA